MKELAEQNLTSFLRNLETKSINGEDGQSLPPEFYKKIYSPIEKTSFFRKYAEVIQTDSPSVSLMLDNRKDAFFWKKEFEKIPQDTGSSLIPKIIYAKTWVLKQVISMEFTEDCPGIEEYLKNKVKDLVTKEEHKIFMTGDGNAQPFGILTKLHNNENRKDVTINKNDFLESLMKCWSLMPNEYVNEGIWIMSLELLPDILSSLKGYITFNPTSEIPMNILGRPIYFSEHFKNSKIKGMFIHMRSSYCIVDRRQISVIKDNFSMVPNTICYSTFRIGGDVINADNIVTLSLEE